MPRITYTDQQAAAVGATKGAFNGAARLNEIAKDRDLHARVRGLARLPDAAQRRRALVGAHALGPEAGEWLQLATLAIRAHAPLDVLGDVTQLFPTFSEIFVGALKALKQEIAARQLASASSANRN